MAYCWALCEYQLGIDWNQIKENHASWYKRSEPRSHLRNESVRSRLKTESLMPSEYGLSNGEMKNWLDRIDYNWAKHLGTLFCTLLVVLQ